jgi:hypothetical protein
MVQQLQAVPVAQLTRLLRSDICLPSLRLLLLADLPKDRHVWAARVRASIVQEQLPAGVAAGGGD